MSTDPMAGYDQAEAEAEARTDEARREQHYTEAVQAARDFVRDDVDVSWLYGRVRSEHPLGGLDSFQRDPMRVLVSFRADYGTPALLRVIADALEASRASR